MEKKRHDEQMEILSTMSNDNQNSCDEYECPYCAETIKYKAILCRYCGHDLTEHKQKDNTNNNATVAISEEVLLKRYGIILSNEKYKYKEYSYDNLNDALNYAKKQEEYLA